MTFETEGEFRFWLKINGYTADVIEELACKWNSITINNGQITDAVTQSTNNEIINEVSDSQN